MSGSRFEFRSSWIFDKDTFVEIIRSGAQRAALEIILRVQDAITEHLSRPGTGKVYRIHGREHRASRPGEPPAAYTGRLRSSWEAGRPESMSLGDRVGWRLGSSVEYARRLEFGGDPIEARPYLRPSIDAVSPLAQAIFAAAIRKALKAALSDSAAGRPQGDQS
jgi:hypothetical protein